MTVKLFKMWLALSLLIAPLNAWSRDKVLGGKSQNLSQLSSLGETLRHAGARPLHILYVHGIGIRGAGDSRPLQKGICDYLKDCQVPAAPESRDYADSGEFATSAEPPAFEYTAKRVWKTRDEWNASAPFVDHYVLRRSAGGPIVVDEFNWWPQTFPLKCRAIIPGEARLAGPDSSLLDLCAQVTEVDTSHPGRFKTYAWITPQEAERLRSFHSEGALFNRRVKNTILDWGFSDAILSVGSMHEVFRDAVRQMLVISVRFNADGSKTGAWEQQWRNPQEIDREFIVISHSLGSYLVFSTLNMGQEEALPQNATAQKEYSARLDNAAAEYVLERTSLVYFLANQIPLLNLANLENPATAEPSPPTQAPSTQAESALNRQMSRWKYLRQAFAGKLGGVQATAMRSPQVVAWSDPSDWLSWRLPEMEGLEITNIYVRNTRWHWLIASPGAVHNNYATNKKVLRILLGPEPGGNREKSRK